MANKIQIRRGNSANLPTLSNGEPGFCEDTSKLYIGNAGSNVYLAGAPRTTDYTLYVATSALGGRAASTGATGEVKRAGTATSTVANKLVDSGAAFDSTYLNKTVYNKSAPGWAKVTAVDSAQQLSLSANIMTSGQTYDIADALDNVQEAFANVVSPYQANVTVRISTGTFSGNIVAAGLYPGKAVTLTLTGTSAGTTTVSGTFDSYIKITVGSLTFSSTVNVNAGSDTTFNTCVGSGLCKVYTNGGGFATYNTCTFTLGNDPGAAVFNGGTITKGYLIYVAPVAKGGVSTNNGLLVTSGTNTGVSASGLVDSAASFTSALVGKTVYNTTDGKAAQIVAYYSATVLGISLDIFTATGKSYVIANAVNTIQGAVDKIPGSVNCDTTVQASDDSYAEAVNIWGKNLSGTYTITMQGLRTIADSGTASSGANPVGNGSAGYGTLTDSTKAWTVNGHQNLWVEITGGTGVGQIRVIHSNTATVLTITGRWDTAPGATSTYRIFSLATTINGVGLTHSVKVDNGQKGVNLKYLKLINAGNDNFKGNLMVFNGSSCNTYWCHFEAGNYWNIQSTASSTGYSEGCVFKGAVIGDFRVDYEGTWTGIKQCRLTGWQNRSIDVAAGVIFNLYQTYVGGGTAGIAIMVNFLGSIYTDAYFEVDGSPSHNIQIQDNAFFWPNALYGAKTTQVVKNAGGWGVLAKNGGIGDGVQGMTYSGNTSGTYTPTTMPAGGTA